MRKIFLLMVLFQLLCAGTAFTAELSAKDAKLLEEAGIPLYEGAVFTNGGLGDELVGARFASSAQVEKVRAFYREKFSNWALNDLYGSWILYDGEPSKSPMAYMGKTQVSVRKEKELPGWFNLPADMTTEIMIVVPPKN